MELVRPWIGHNDDMARAAMLERPSGLITCALQTSAKQSKYFSLQAL
jgi:hypothetical protein